MTSAALPAIFPAWFRTRSLSFLTARKSLAIRRGQTQSEIHEKFRSRQDKAISKICGPDADSRDGGQEQPGGGADPQRSGRGAGGSPTRLWSLTHGMK